MKRQPRQQITWMTSSWVICYLHLVTLSPRHSPPSTPPAHEREERVPERREGMSDTSEGAAEAVRRMVNQGNRMLAKVVLFPVLFTSVLGSFHLYPLPFFTSHSLPPVRFTLLTARFPHLRSE